MYGVHGRDSVYIVAMRRRAELLPRPFTQTEHAVLARYSQNMQNGAEYFGLLGLVGGAYWGTRTEFWPMEKTFRTMFGLKGGATGPGEAVPPSGFVYPNGWGQKEGGGSTGPAGAGSTPNPTAGSTSTTAPKVANTGASPVIPPHSNSWGSSNPPLSRFDVTKITADYLRGPRIKPMEPTFNYSWAPMLQRWLYMLQLPPQYIVNFTMWQIRRIGATPPEQRGTESYKQKYDIAEWTVRWVRSWGLRIDETRENTKKGMDTQLARARANDIGGLEEIEALVKEYEEFDKRMAEARKTWVGKTSALEGEIEAELVARRAAARASARPTARPPASGKATGSWGETKEEFKIRLDEAENEVRAKEKMRHEVPRNAIIIRINPLKSIKDAIRAGTWAFFGKYVIGTIGLMWLTSGSRRKEIADERLQEYNYDRMEYAKLRMKEAVARRGLPIPPTAPPQQPHHDDGGESGSRQPERFKSVDNQSLGGVQSESIDWGDLVKDDTPVIARQQSKDSTLPPIRPGESAWDRARRAMEGPQGPAMEEDRWAPQGQQDTAPKTDDMASMSRWEKIRQQASEGYASERRVPGENRDGGDGPGSFGGFGRRQQGQDKQKTKEELQREFDAQVEKERRGEEGAWK